MQNQRLTDNIFLDTRRQGTYTAYPVKNVLSYHDEILIPRNPQIQSQNIIYKIKLRIINPENITNFQSLLEQEMWDAVYKADNVDSTFSLFLKTFLTIYENSFPIVCKRYENTNNNSWMTKGIRISCNRKGAFMFYAQKQIII
jgi:hypothetical protein